MANHFLLRYSMECKEGIYCIPWREGECTDKIHRIKKRPPPPPPYPPPPHLAPAPPSPPAIQVAEPSHLTSTPATRRQADPKKTIDSFEDSNRRVDTPAVSHSSSSHDVMRRFADAFVSFIVANNRSGGRYAHIREDFMRSSIVSNNPEFRSLTLNKQFVLSECKDYLTWVQDSTSTSRLPQLFLRKRRPLCTFELNRDNQNHSYHRRVRSPSPDSPTVEAVVDRTQVPSPVSPEQEEIMQQTDTLNVVEPIPAVLAEEVENPSYTSAPAIFQSDLRSTVTSSVVPAAVGLPPQSSPPPIYSPPKDPRSPGRRQKLEMPVGPPPPADPKLSVCLFDSFPSTRSMLSSDNMPAGLQESTFSTTDVIKHSSASDSVTRIGAPSVIPNPSLPQKLLLSSIHDPPISLQEVLDVAPVGNIDKSDIISISGFPPESVPPLKTNILGYLMDDVQNRAQIYFALYIRQLLGFHAESGSKLLDGHALVELICGQPIGTLTYGAVEDEAAFKSMHSYMSSNSFIMEATDSGHPDSVLYLVPTSNNAGYIRLLLYEATNINPTWLQEGRHLIAGRKLALFILIQDLLYKENEPANPTIDPDMINLCRKILSLYNIWLVVDNTNSIEMLAAVRLLSHLDPNADLNGSVTLHCLDGLDKLQQQLPVPSCFSIILGSLRVCKAWMVDALPFCLSVEEKSLNDIGMLLFLVANSFYSQFDELKVKINGLKDVSRETYFRFYSLKHQEAATSVILPEQLKLFDNVRIGPS